MLHGVLKNPRAFFPCTDVSMLIFILHPEFHGRKMATTSLCTVASHSGLQREQVRGEGRWALLKSHFLSWRRRFILRSPSSELPSHWPKLDHMATRSSKEQESKYLAVGNGITLWLRPIMVSQVTWTKSGFLWQRRWQ